MHGFIDYRMLETYNAVSYLERSTLKNGKPGNKILDVWVPYSPIRACDLCGKLGNKRRVMIRNDVYSWNKEHKKDYTTKLKNMLCMSCWNKVRPIYYKEQECDALLFLIRKLEREISNAKRNAHQNNW